MTKPAERTITYMVYPPGWEPGTGGYFKLDTLKKAIRKAKALGKGAEVWRGVSVSHRRRNSKAMKAHCSVSYSFDFYGEIL